MTDQEIAPRAQLRDVFDERRPTVLLIDDEPGLLEVAGDIVASLGCRSIAARDGGEGLSAVEVCPQISLVILDLFLPDLSGSEVLARIHAMRPDLPVLIASGTDPDAVAVLADRPGCAGFLEKPFRLDLMASRVRELLGLRAEMAPVAGLLEQQFDLPEGGDWFRETLSVS